MPDQSNSNSLTRTDGGSVPVLQPNQFLAFGDASGVTLSGLTEQQQRALIEQHARGLVDVNRKAAELGVDVQALGKVLDQGVAITRQASQDGNSATFTHSQTSSIGRTEVIIGNTETASQGKMSRSQTGERDKTMIYLGIAAVVIIALALILTR
jgi:hypothetical protein